MSTTLDKQLADRAVEAVASQNGADALEVLRDIVVAATTGGGAPSAPAKAPPAAPKPKAPAPAQARRVETKYGPVTLDAMEVEECTLAGADLIAYATHKVEQARRANGKAFWKGAL